MSPNPRVINLHITSYIQYPEPLSSWWFHLFFVFFHPEIRGNDPTWVINMFPMGWNHHLVVHYLDWFHISWPLIFKRSWSVWGVIMLPTQTPNHALLRECLQITNICIVWSPQNGYSPGVIEWPLFFAMFWTSYQDNVRHKRRLENLWVVEQSLGDILVLVGHVKGIL